MDSLPTSRDFIQVVLHKKVFITLIIQKNTVWMPRVEKKIYICSFAADKHEWKIRDTVFTGAKIKLIN